MPSTIRGVSAVCSALALLFLPVVDMSDARAATVAGGANGWRVSGSGAAWLRPGELAAWHGRTAVLDVAVDPRTYARRLVARYGWDGTQWSCLNALWTRESDWTVSADNPSTDAYGIPQALPGDRMASFGADWRTNARTQIRWGLSYIADRYGTPCAAWQHSLDSNWY